MIAHTYPLSGAKVLFKLIGLKSLAHKLRKKISVIRHNHMLNETKIFHTLSPNLLIGITRAFRHLEKMLPTYSKMDLIQNSDYLKDLPYGSLNASHRSFLKTLLCMDLIPLQAFPRPLLIKKSRIGHLEPMLVIKKLL